MRLKCKVCIHEISPEVSEEFIEWLEDHIQMKELREQFEILE